MEAPSLLDVDSTAGGLAEEPGAGALEEKGLKTGADGAAGALPLEEELNVAGAAEKPVGAGGVAVLLKLKEGPDAAFGALLFSPNRDFEGAALAEEALPKEKSGAAVVEALKFCFGAAVTAETPPLERPGPALFDRALAKIFAVADSVFRCFLEGVPVSARVSSGSCSTFRFTDKLDSVPVTPSAKARSFLSSMIFAEMAELKSKCHLESWVQSARGWALRSFSRKARLSECKADVSLHRWLSYSSSPSGGCCSGLKSNGLEIPGIGFTMGSFGKEPVVDALDCAFERFWNIEPELL